MSRRERFLDLLRSVSGFRASVLPSEFRRSRQTKALRLESLEERRVLAVAVSEFVPTDTGFIVQFDEAVDTSTLNLYDTESGAMGPADATLTGATTGVVDGSLVVNGSTLTFVATAGLLPADTYNMVLRSAENGFKSLANGELLDGDGNGTAGGNFTTAFTVSANSHIVVSIPNFARGPSQSAQAPASGAGAPLSTGLPVRVSNAAGVTSMTLTLEYDPALLEVTDVVLGADAPSDSQIEVNLTTPGTITVAYFSLDPMTAGEASLFELVGQVPGSATYGRAHVMRMTSIDVNAGAITARTDDALHVVAFAGDVNANRRYDAEDARLIARVGVGLDRGFVTSTPTSTTIAQALFPLIDPMILGDVTGAGGISPLDASDVLRKVVGLDVPNLPDLPSSQGPTAISLSNQTLTGDIAAGTTVGTLSTSDPDVNDMFTYTLVTGSGDTDNASFSIAGNTLRTAASLTPAASPYSVRIRTTDAAGNVLDRVFSITITVTASNAAPTGIALSSTSFAESTTPGTAVATLSSTDPNAGDTFTYSLVSGTGSADNATFSVSGNQLLLSSSVNFEVKSSYSVRLRTTDQVGASFEQAFTLNVTDSNDSPTAVSISATSVPSGAPAGTLIGNFSTTDEDSSDTHSYTLVAGAGDSDNASFTISGGELLIASSLNAASQSNYSIRVRSTDSSGASVEQVITGAVVEGNTAPTGISLSSTSFGENTTSGAAIATLSSTDANVSDTFSYSLVSGTGSTDNGAFTISGDQLLLNASVDFETKSSYGIRLRTTDAAGESFEQAFTLSVTDNNDAPSDLAISSSAVASGAVAGTVVGSFTTTDQDAADLHTYTLVAGMGAADNSAFTISGNQLLTAVVLQTSTQESYSIRVRSTDSSGEFIERVITGNVVITNSAPTGINLSSTNFPESTPTGTSLATLTSVDANPDDTFVYSLVDGVGSEDNLSFAIDGNQLLLEGTVDFETKSSYSIRLRTTDSTGLTFEDVFEMRVVDDNDAPQQISVSATDVSLNVAVGSVVGTLTTFDQDPGDTHVYSLVDGTGATDNAAFAISGNQLVTGVVFDATGPSSYSIRVRSTDGAGAFIERIISGNIVNSNSAPTGVDLSSNSFSEATTVGTTVATLSTIDANLNESFVYSLVDGTAADDNAAFTITDNALVLNAVADFEIQSEYNIRIRTTDSGGATFEQPFVLTVLNANEAATEISLSNSSIADAAPLGTVVGLLSANDPDANDSLVFSLAVGSGDADNSSFTINGAELVTNFLADINAQSSYSVRVAVTDALGLVYEQVLTLSVVDSNLAPTSIALNPASVSEESPAGTTVGTLSTSDPNVADTHAYTLVTGEGGADNSAFEIVAGELRIIGQSDFETQNTYSIRVRSTDAGGLFVEQALTINVQDVNESPTGIQLSSNTIPENSAVATLVGTLATSDPDSGETHNYMLTSGAGDTDNALFTIVGNELRVVGSLDFEARTTYSVRVQTSDAGGLLFEQPFTIDVTDVNESPTRIELSSHLIIDGSAAGTVVGTLTADDPDAGETFTFTLMAGDGDDDNGSFSITGDQLAIGFTADTAAQSSFVVRVQVTDSAGATFSQSLVMVVTEQPLAPTDIGLSASSIAENAPVGTTVGTLSTTDASTTDSHAYTLVAGDGDADNAKFSIDGNLLVTAAEIDFEIQSSFSIRIRSTDATDLFIEKTFVITVENINEAPTALELTKNSVADQQPAGTLVGLFGTADPDTGDTFTYSLVAGEGDADNAQFEIDNGQLRMAASVDAAVQSLYSIRVRSQDAGGLFVEEILDILVSSVNQQPTDIILSSNTVAEDASIGTVLGTLSTIDGNEQDTHTYQLVAGAGDADNGIFLIQGNQLILNAPLDFDTQPTLTIRIRSEDPYGLSIEEELVINVQQAL